MRPKSWLVEAGARIEPHDCRKLGLRSPKPSSLPAASALAAGNQDPSMYSFTELQGQSSQDKHGGIRLNTAYQTVKKPVWLVLLKLAVLMTMVAMAAAVITPTLAQWLPLWKATLATIGILLIYIGIAFFFRPEANTDNMGWFGGFGNDPFQYSDNVNRFLFKLHMFLGPGRFAAETMLDACALVGLAKGPEVIEEKQEESPPAVLFDPAAYSEATQQVAPPAIDPPPLRADRFNLPQAQMPRPM